MRIANDRAMAPRVAVTAALLTLGVFLSGCASKSAHNQSSHYGTERSSVAMSGVVPRPVARARRQGLGRGVPPEERSTSVGEPMDDAARYADVYGVAPPPPYNDVGQQQSIVAATLDVEPIASPVYGDKRIVVTFGDTLYNLAWRYKTTVSALLIANQLRNTNIQIGQELIVPPARR